jgi:hypothetical protein
MQIEDWRMGKSHILLYEKSRAVTSIKKTIGKKKLCNRQKYGLFWQFKRSLVLGLRGNTGFSMVF